MERRTPFVNHLYIMSGRTREEVERECYGRICLWCGSRNISRRRHFCSATCKRKYDGWKRRIKELALDISEKPELGTIIIRERVSGESWRNYNAYLRSLLPY